MKKILLLSAAVIIFWGAFAQLRISDALGDTDKNQNNEIILQTNSDKNPGFVLRNSKGDPILAHYTGLGADNIFRSGTFFLGDTELQTSTNIGVYHQTNPEGLIFYCGTIIGDYFCALTNEGVLYRSGNMESWELVAGTGTNAAGIAHDKVNDKTYFLQLVGGVFPDYSIFLWDLDASTGVATQIAQSPQTGYPLGFAADNNGNLYIMLFNSSGNAQFYQMNKTTAAMTLIGNTGQEASSFVQSMCFDPATNKCYFQAFDHGTKMSGTYEINIATGNATSIGGHLPYAITAIAIKDEGTGINKFSDKNFNIYPNPSSGIVNVEVNENSTVRVLNILGKLIDTYNINANETLKFTQSRGMYIIQIESNGKVSNKKVIIK